MRCRRLATLLTLVAALGVAPAASAATVATPPATVTLDACHPSADALARYAVFTAQLVSVPGTAHMRVRFEVVGRKGAARHYRQLSGPGLGVWRSSLAGVGRFVVRKQVANLPAGGDARAIVSFRWIDASGAIIRRARLHTPLCHQPDLRPDFAIAGLTAKPAADPSKAIYTAAVRNGGVGAAGPFDVGLSVGGAAESLQSVPALAAGTTASVTFTAPRCAPGGSVLVRADPAGRVDEPVKSDDDRTFPCPLAP